MKVLVLRRKMEKNKPLSSQTGWVYESLILKKEDIYLAVGVEVVEWKLVKERLEELRSLIQQQIDRPLPTNAKIIGMSEKDQKLFDDAGRAGLALSLILIDHVFGFSQTEDADLPKAGKIQAPETFVSPGEKKDKIIVPDPNHYEPVSKKEAERVRKILSKLGSGEKETTVNTTKKESKYRNVKKTVLGKKEKDETV